MKLKNFRIITLIMFMIMGNQSINGQTTFQGIAYYKSKTTMDFSRFRGRQLSEQQKNEMQERMRSFLEKTFVLHFNAEASLFKEEEKLAAPTTNGGGRGFGFMNSFSSGPIYKNVRTKTFLQDQEFFGKQFLIKEPLQNYTWIMGKESRKIGAYTAFKATTTLAASELNWTRPQPARNQDSQDEMEEPDAMINVTAWYTPQIPVSQGPGEFWGLPGLILELNTGETVMLCSKIVLNPAQKEDIKMPDKGKEVTKKEYSITITEKITELRENRRRRNPNRR